MEDKETCKECGCEIVNGKCECKECDCKEDDKNCNCNEKCDCGCN
jgi:hypothetical protein